MSFSVAEKIADAVLYEGYVLYPYRASSAKNRVRWQFGVFVPRVVTDRGHSEPWAMQTECLVEGSSHTVVDICLRFLQLQARSVETVQGEVVDALEVDGQSWVTWDEGIPQSIHLVPVRIADLLDNPRTVPFGVANEESFQPLGSAGCLHFSRWSISGRMVLSAEAVGNLYRLQVRVENLSEWPEEPPQERNLILRRALLGAHTLLAVSGGAFVSLLEPPPGIEAAVADCVNENTWPVLVGSPPSRQVMLSSPIILYDYPKVADESQGDFCDATEIDEILTLRVMTMTDAEKREARVTDARTRQIVERSDQIPAEMMDRLHGAVRSLRPVERREAELIDFQEFLDGERPEVASMKVDGHEVRKGSTVILRPRRRADSMDMFLAGRKAIVQGVFRDVDDTLYAGVTVADDPGADLHESYGRFFYFHANEIETVK